MTGETLAQSAALLLPRRAMTPSAAMKFPCRSSSGEVLRLPVDAGASKNAWLVVGEGGDESSVGKGERPSHIPRSP